MTLEQKTKKLADLDRLLELASSTSPSDRARARSTIGFQVEDARLLAENLRRQLAGEAPPERAYHVTRNPTSDALSN